MKEKISDFLESGTNVILSLILIGLVIAGISIARSYFTRGMDEASKTSDSALETVYTKYEGSVKGRRCKVPSRNSLAMKISGFLMCQPAAPRNL